jgi:hypothetical protein
MLDNPGLLDVEKSRFYKPGAAGRISMQQQTPRDDLMYRSNGEYLRNVPYRQLAT